MNFQIIGIDLDGGYRLSFLKHLCLKRLDWWMTGFLVGWHETYDKIEKGRRQTDLLFFSLFSLSFFLSFFQLSTFLYFSLSPAPSLSPSLFFSLRIFLFKQQHLWKLIRQSVRQILSGDSLASSASSSGLNPPVETSALTGAWKCNCPLF